MDFKSELQESLNLMNQLTEQAHELTDIASVAEMWDVSQVAKFMKVSENAAREFLNSKALQEKVPVFKLSKGYTVNNLALIKYTMTV